MAKAIPSPIIIRGKEAFLRQLVCEVRYQDGYLYLDHCGQLLKRLVGENPEWVVAPEPTAQRTSLVNLRTGGQLHFNSGAASLALDKTASDEAIDAQEVNDFIDLIDPALGLVFDELEVTSCTRVGCRAQHYFSFDSREEAGKWIMDLGLFTVHQGLFEAFKATLESMGGAMVLQGEDCHYRVAINGIERSAQIPVGEAVLTVRASTAPRNQRKILLESLKKKRQRQINSAFAVVVDIDAYLDEPSEANAAEFVREHAEQDLKRFRDALPREQARKAK